MYRMLYLLHFLVLFISESKGQAGFCRQDKPVVRFCTDNWLTNVTDVYIDTSSVPMYIEIVCECTIFPFVPGIRFTFSYYDRVVPGNMVFKLNDVLLISKVNINVWNADRANLLLLTTKNYTTEGTCLISSSGTLF
ncbi:uncharacterized protein LOC123544292 isoform X2 [Mercenaria mercenaria]|uniref:uncharacterized protein LOC123544292 isoform X2 n=1 Tax=Mercenaria mercenaria TaxID=6596 RepID=UPI00234F7E4D|nr:uncharacterized protein LOC123544292 isoform X2 [Mercenaria mercenaria]